jgi:hypothetical protein
MGARNGDVRRQDDFCSRVVTDRELIVITPSGEAVVMQQPTRFHKGDRVVVKETGEEGVIEKVRLGEGDADKYYLDEEYVVRVKSGRWYSRGALEFEPFDSA